VWAQPCGIPDSLKLALDGERTGGATAAGAAKNVRDRYPANYFAHRAWQDLNIDRGVFAADVQIDYRALRDEHPDDPLYLTLYARALTGTRTPEALTVLESALAKQPGYPYAHLEMVEIYTSPMFRDDQKLRVHLLAYRKSCPTVLAAYTMVGRIDDAGFLRESAAGLRPLLERRTDPEALAAYDKLWTMEFKGVPLTAQQEVRERVRGDVAKLRGMELSANPSLAATLLQGYKIVGDAEGTKWAEGLPGNQSALSPATEAINKWRFANPPSKSASYQDYRALLAQKADEWIREWPDDPRARAEKYWTCTWDGPLEESTRAAEEWVRTYELHPGGSPAPYDSVVQFYVGKNTHFDELLGLIEKALKQIKEVPQASLSDLYPPRTIPRAEGDSSKWWSLSNAAHAYIELKEYGKARELLAKLRASLLADKLPADAPQSEKAHYAAGEQFYWSTNSRLAHVEGRKLDEFAFLRNAYLTFRTDEPASYQDDRLNAMKSLWKELHGSEEGFEAFMNPPGGTPKPPDPEPPKPEVVSTSGTWTPREKPLPEFQFSDAKGKTWQLADLKGKVTLINLWATWCGPCRAELPYLQKVYDKVRERKDLQVITFDTDDSLGLILPFIAGNKYTFPVMPAVDYVRKLVPDLTIPRNWIVDADGVLRSEKLGFGSGDDKWVDDMIATMEKARK